MELSVKTTILLTPELHDRLTRLAEREDTSLGALVREACERQYGIAGSQERAVAVRELARLDLPVGSARAMKRESLVRPDKLLP